MKLNIRSLLHVRPLLLIALTVLTLVIIPLIIWLVRLDRNITQRLTEKRFAPPVEFFSAPERVSAGSIFPPHYFENLFSRRRFRPRTFGQPLQPEDYSLWAGEECRGVVPTTSASSIGSCIAFRNPTDSAFRNPINSAFRNPTDSAFDEVQIIALDMDGRVSATFAGTPLQIKSEVQIAPELFAQYYGDKPTLRRVVSLGDAPVNCLNALLAIEDSQFLEHGGVSLSGAVRALLANLRSGHVAQGGSTITQQLVKNFFLTDERTFKRKITEAAMAMLLEGHASKDDILETYINLIYMGQNGSFQVRGFGAAAEHYFGSDLNSLNLDQCALMAALVNSPGLFNPFTHPDNARKRRSRVLERMIELKLVDPSEAAAAKVAPLPEKPQRGLTEPAPYFVQAVRQQLAKENLDEAEGLRVYTTLNLRAQEAAHQAVRMGIEHLEKTYPWIRKMKDKGKELQAVFLSADPSNGYVQAVEGGRNFQTTQFNRATDGHRQVGSIMKPFVFLTALETTNSDGKPYTPITILQDDTFTHKYQGQAWSPKNYDNEYFGSIPMYFALKESLNSATASLGISVGLTNIVDTARRLGVQSPISALPSITLGAFELYPWEVLQAYSTLSQLGRLTPLTYIAQVDDLTGRTVFKNDPAMAQVVAPEVASELVGMMKQTLLNGTARATRLSGVTMPAAGKTGTTNDKKDAWFAGFTPHHVALAWVGYDDNTSHNLTGASGAVPLWTQYMKAYGNSFPPDDFPWAPGTQVVTLTPAQQKSLGVPERETLPLEPIQLVFKTGQAP